MPSSTSATEVRDHERAAAVGRSLSGEAQEVAEADGGAGDREDDAETRGPLFRRRLRRHVMTNPFREPTLGVASGPHPVTGGPLAAACLNGPWPSPTSRHSHPVSRQPTRSSERRVRKAAGGARPAVGEVSTAIVACRGAPTEAPRQDRRERGPAVPARPRAPPSVVSSRTSAFPGRLTRWPSGSLRLRRARHVRRRCEGRR